MTRGLPEMPPRASMRMSPAAASRRTRCQEEAHAGGGVLIGVVEGPDAERDNGDGSAGADEKCREVKPAYAPATPGEPRRGDHVEGDDAADDVAMLRLHDGETEGA